MTTNGKDPVHLALEMLVYAPVGFALMAYQRAPALVGDIMAKGVAQLGEAEAKVNQAKMIGQVAVTFGSRMIRKDLDSRLGEACKKAEFLAGFIPGLRNDDDEDDDLLAEPLTGQPATAAGASKPAPAPARPAAKTAPAKTAPATAPGPVAGDLPIPEYDGLSASQVVSRLSGLTPAELEAVAAYETAGRARKTVLGAIDRLRP
ncbi:MAG: hypothetical protein ACRDZ3_02090 [Acidimicrobiia bacterium]